MRTVVTGASGLLGSNLAIELLCQGHSVRATRRANSRVAHLAGFAIDWCDADLADADSLAHVDGTKHVLSAMREAGAQRLIHSSGPADVAIADALRWLQAHGARRETRVSVPA